MTPKRSIVLVYYREADYLRSVLLALEAEFPHREETEIIVVDNHSGDNLQPEIVTAHPGIHWISSPTNLYYGGGNNVGVAAATGEWVAIVNTDVAWEPGQLRQFVLSVESSEMKLAAPLLRYPDGRIQISAHRSFPSLLSVAVDYCLPLQLLCMYLGIHPMQYGLREHRNRVVAHITGVCLYLPRAIFLQYGGFDPKYTMYLEETDFQRRLAAGGILPHLIASTSLTHYGSAQKTWAQAGPHYLRSLKIYTQRWWSPISRASLRPVILLSAIISLLSLTIAFVPSMLIWKSHLRIRHYLQSYMFLLHNLVRS